MRPPTEDRGHTVEIKNRPIVVCGPGRGGTTAVRALLNTHPEIALAREIPLGRLPSLPPLLAEIERHHRDQWTEQRRHEVVKALWYSASRPMPAKSDAHRWGMKTPWSELDADLWSPLVDPMYVYCLRRGDRVFQSHIRLGWITGPPSVLIGRYKESLRAYEDLRSKAPTHIVQLDLVKGPADRRRLAEGLFAFVGEKPEEQTLREIATWSKLLNKPTSVPGEEPKLPEEWQELLAADSEYQEMMHAHGY
jgi:hypothetical protein